MNTKYTSLIILLFFNGWLGAQTAYNEEAKQELQEMSIPSAPAFALLGVNPEMVTRPSDVKAFKVDWRIKNYKVAPDLALEAQPLWQLYYKHKGPKALLNMSPLEAVLSTTSFSLATAKIDNVNHLAWAVKMNLYKEKDPLRANLLLTEKQKKLNEKLHSIDLKIDSLSKLQLEVDLVDPAAVQFEIQELIYSKKILTVSTMEKLLEESNELINAHWNMDMIDAGFGRVYTYNNNAIDSINLRKAGYGVWVSGAKGIGKRSLLNSILKVNHVGINNDLYVGLAYRYGSSKFNFFTELIMSRKGNNPENGILEDDQFADLKSDDLGLGWYGFQSGEMQTKWTLTYGGDFRISRNILLNFALRTNLNNKLKFQSFIPIANIVCLMK